MSPHDPQPDASRDGSLQRQLKSKTATLHERVEAQLGLLEPQLSLHRYRQVLESFYGFYAPVELRLARLAAAVPQLGFSLRARAKLIESDLMALGLPRREITALPWCSDLPRLSRPEHLAGCLYVLEGACLGGQVVARVVQRHLGLKKESGASFFVGDADGTAPRWRLVLTWLERLADAGAATEQIVAVARETFLELARWLEQRGTAS